MDHHAKARLRRAVLPQMKAVELEARAVLSSKLAFLLADAIDSAIASRRPWSSRRPTVALFLSQRQEINMAPYMDVAWDKGYRVLVPQTVSTTSTSEATPNVKTRPSMVFVEAFNQKDVEVSFPPQGKLNLRELRPDLLSEAIAGGGYPPRAVVDGMRAAEEIDVIVAPGVAFDSHGGRCGRGAGYYDEYLRQARQASAAKALPPPVVIGVCYAAQFLEGPKSESSTMLWWPTDIGAVPMTDSDERVDVVVTPSGIYRCSFKEHPLRT